MIHCSLFFSLIPQSQQVEQNINLNQKNLILIETVSLSKLKKINATSAFVQRLIPYRFIHILTLRLRAKISL